MPVLHLDCWTDGDSCGPRELRGSAEDPSLVASWMSFLEEIQTTLQMSCLIA